MQKTDLRQGSSAITRKEFKDEKSGPVDAVDQAIFKSKQLLVSQSKKQLGAASINTDTDDNVEHSPLQQKSADSEQRAAMAKNAYELSKLLVHGKPSRPQRAELNHNSHATTVGTNQGNLSSTRDESTRPELISTRAPQMVQEEGTQSLSKQFEYSREAGEFSLAENNLKIAQEMDQNFNSREAQEQQQHFQTQEINDRGRCGGSNPEDQQIIEPCGDQQLQHSNDLVGKQKSTKLDKKQELAVFAEVNQVKILQEALLEVFERNETLEQRVRLLEKQLADARAESQAKDTAIAELAAALDAQMEGAVTEALDQM